MIISLIVAMDQNQGIGFEGQLAWHLPADLKRFKSLTMGHHLIMGRKTYESIGSPLPGRTMIIVTRNPVYQPEGCMVAHSIDTALDFARMGSDNEAFIIGGGDLFAQTIDLADRIYLTQVHASLPADVYFPDYSELDWREIETEFNPADEKNQYAVTFKVLVRKEENIK
ncbi:MAG: dihydrofolate reductase [Anaerolineales bacterium]